jgi:hypothetical protein
MSVNLRKRHDAGIKLLEIAELCKKYRPDLTAKTALKLAILANPKLGELYTGLPIRRDGFGEVKNFLLNGGPVPQD